MSTIATKPHMVWPRAFRLATTGGAIGVLAAGAANIPAGDARAAALMFALVFLSRSVPVVMTREKAITFTAASVFAASMLLDGVSAGLFALIACSVHAWLFQSGGKSYSVFLGAQYALAAMASDWVYLAVNAGVRAGHVGSGDAAAIAAASAAFVLVNVLLVALGNLGTRYASWQYAESVARVQALAYLVSFPYAVLLVCAYQSVGLPALPVMAALLLVCAFGVRLRVENRILAKQLAAVETLGNSCAASVRAEAPLQQFLSLARDLVTYQKAVVWMAEEGRSDLRPRVIVPDGAPPPNPDLGASGSVVDRCASRNSALLIRNTSQDPRIAGGDSGQSWILLPMMLHGKSVGVAQFVRRASRPFTRVEQMRLATLVPHVTIAFESVRIRQLMHRYANMATTDSLTGLYNHRKCHEILADEVKRATRYNRLVSVLMLDVDAFKQFNDTFGHPQGDVLLRGVARILRESLRATDFIGRYGGEEFLVILPETGRAEACALAERVRRTVGSTDFVLDRGQVVCRTVSIGVASYPEDGALPADLVRTADEALYRAKRSGKNRVLTS